MTKEEAIDQQIAELAKAAKMKTLGRDWVENLQWEIAADMILKNLEKLKDAQPGDSIEILRANF